MNQVAKPLCAGYVVGPRPHPRDSSKVLWKVRVQTPGAYQAKVATIDRNNVPEGIFSGADVQFNLVTAGRGGGLVAVNAALTVRQAKTVER